jgi:hypothetical protein
MKPPNVNPPLLLPDGEPVHCRFLARADAPIFWESCSQLATVQLDEAELARFQVWLEMFPKALIGLDPGWGYLCDTHAATIRQCMV